MDTETRTLDCFVQRALPLKSTIQRSGLARPADAIVRAAAALVAASVEPDGENKYLRAIRGDEVTPMILRAATGVGTLADSTWAGNLAQSAVADFLLSLGPLSAGSQLMAYSNSIPLGHRGITALGILPGAVTGGFVGEGEPIPVKGWSVSGGVIEPKKLAFISAISREVAKGSNAEALIREVMQQSAALTLDAALFNASAASAAAPAGLLNGATDLTGSNPANVFSGDEAGITDALAALAAAVAPVAFGDIVFVAGAQTAARLQIMLGYKMPFPILSTTGLASGAVAAIAPRALAFAVEPTPEITTSSTAVIHMSDTPLPISDGGVADPVRGVWQTAALAIRFSALMSWAKRVPGAVAFIS